MSLALEALKSGQVCSPTDATRTALGCGDHALQYRQAVAKAIGVVAVARFELMPLEFPT